MAASVLSALAENVAARRARRAKAITRVQELRRHPALVVGQTVAKWLKTAYGWQTKPGRVGHPYWILERGRQTLLLWARNGESRVTWRDVDDVLEAKAHYNADIAAIAAPAGVPDPEELSETQVETVHLWGPLQLERIYVEIEHELDGVPL
jgi:hypothetical protein